jgi:hypothetical protein
MKTKTVKVALYTPSGQRISPQNLTLVTRPVSGMFIRFGSKKYIVKEVKDSQIPSADPNKKEVHTTVEEADE